SDWLWGGRGRGDGRRDRGSGSRARRLGRRSPSGSRTRDLHPVSGARRGGGLGTALHGLGCPGGRTLARQRRTGGREMAGVDGPRGRGTRRCNRRTGGIHELASRTAPHDTVLRRGRRPRNTDRRRRGRSGREHPLDVAGVRRGLRAGGRGRCAPAGGATPCGRATTRRGCRHRLLGRLNSPHEALALRLTADAVALRVLDRGRVALHADP
ncbi:MAG: hypothetical protein JWM85_2759, partial [Acidimicrobiaceae bacterium]|nr:hypothetical protein [Acidimicrobiaceae bacterium]